MAAESAGAADFPKRIEAFDISNLGSTGIVAAMTVHINGKPLKRDYRKFRIRGLDAPDDYASMYQAIYRRFSHWREGDEKFRPCRICCSSTAATSMPRQRAARPRYYSPGVRYGHDDRHRTRALIDSAGHETGIKTNQAVYALVGSIQEGDAPLRDRVPALAEKRELRIEARRDTGRRREAERRSAEILQVRQSDTRGER